MAITDLINYANAIRSIESSGNYGAMGPATRNGDRAYGAYQVMGNNIPGWTAKHYGQSLTPEQFLKSKEAQDAVFNGEFGGSVSKYGNPQDAASVWFSGRPMAGNNSNDGSIAVPEYVRRFNAALGQGGGGALSAIENAAPSGTSMPPGALAFAGGGAQGGSAPAQPDQAANSGVLFQGEQPNKLYGIGSTLANVGAAIAGISNPSQANSLRGIAQGIEAQGHGKFQYQMGPNGQLLRINKDTNRVDSIAIPDAQKSAWQVVKTGKDQMGNEIYQSFNPQTNEFRAIGGGGNAAQTDPANPYSLPADKEELKTKDPSLYNQIVGVEEGRIAYPTGSRVNPQLQKLRDAVNYYNAGVDANLFNARRKFVEGKSTSNPTSFGGLMQRGEIAIDQMDKTLDSYGKLGNWDSGLGVGAAKVENYATSGGTERGKVYKELETNATNASTDINAIQNGGRGTGAEREHIKNGLLLPYDSHKVQSGAVQAHIDALKSAVDARFAQEKSQLGEDYLARDPDYIRMTKKLEDLQSKANKLYSGDFSYVKGGKNTASPAKPAAIPSNWDEAQKAGWK